jgi:mRNA interferase RelE/StbE
MVVVYLERRAERDLKNLPRHILPRIRETLFDLRTNPRPSSTHKLAGSRRDWRIRVGNYRILYEINDQDRTVKVYRIKHRKEVYRF